jgi:hypothetical protein
MKDSTAVGVLFETGFVLAKGEDEDIMAHPVIVDGRNSDTPKQNVNRVCHPRN